LINLEPNCDAFGIPSTAAAAGTEPGRWLAGRLVQPQENLRERSSMVINQYLRGVNSRKFVHCLEYALNLNGSSLNKN
jgi:hypothetical protein